MLQQRNLCHDITKIRRLNYVAIMDFYVTTLPEKFLKKNVVTFFCFVATLIYAYGNIVFSRHSNLCRGIKELKREERMLRYNKTMSRQKMAK